MPWINSAAIRKPTEKGMLGDIDSHLPKGHIYRDSDKVTWAHETTHGINARIRNESRSQNGYYCLFNRAFTIPSPSFTLRDLAQAIPKEKRGKTYQLYLVDQQRHWNDTPLYVVDELTAYTNGAIVGIEHGMKDRADYSLSCAIEMYDYSKTALLLSQETSYEHYEEFHRFVQWYFSGPLRLAVNMYKKIG
jgi:hypothetical protein